MRRLAKTAFIAAGCAVTLLGSQDASALTITRTFAATGAALPYGAGTAGAASTNVAGGGNLMDLVNRAADCWEMAIMDTHTVAITFAWQALGGGTLGVHGRGTQGGSPNRETAAVVRFTNVAGVAWFMDSTPTTHTEYSGYTETMANLGGGNMNVGRRSTGGTGNAAGRTDFLSVAYHEIGHALGMSGANTAFQAENGDLDIDITAPRAHAGAALPTISGAHLNLSQSLMFPSIGTGYRNHISAADVLANGQISQFTMLNLNPCAVPEPASMAGLAMGIALIARRMRKRA